MSQFFASGGQSIVTSWITALSWWWGLHNSMKLWARLHRVIQDGRVPVKSSDKPWSTGEGNSNPLWYSCLENQTGNPTPKFWYVCLSFLFSSTANNPVTLLCPNPNPLFSNHKQWYPRIVYSEYYLYDFLFIQNIQIFLISHWNHLNVTQTCMPEASILCGEKSMYEHTESSANGNNICFFRLQDQHHSTEALLALCILWETFIFHHTTISISDFNVPSSCCCQMSLWL